MPSADALALIGTNEFFRWNVAAPVGTSIVVTYAFGSSPASYDTEARPSFTPFSATQQQYIREALGVWAAASGISFVEVPDAIGGQIRFGMYDMSGSANAVGTQANGFGFFPRYTLSGGNAQPAFNNLGGDIFINTTLVAGNDAIMAPGQRGFSLMLHEIGHVLGFKHPFEETPLIDPTHDNSTFTVLSYNRPNSVVSLGSADIEASQYYYGAFDLPLSWDPVTLTLTRTGTASAEWLLGTDVRDVLYGGGGNDTVRGELGDDVLFGGEGDDVLDGGATGFDALYGGAGADTLNGGSSEDILVGDSGNDTLNGGDGGDVLSELFDVINSGNDTLNGGNGIDIMYSAAGDDTVNGGTDSANNYGNLGDGVDVYNGSSGTDVVVAGAGNDTINGNNGDDSLYGEDGNDSIFGGSGIDLLSGATGNDILDGGSGNDLLVGDGGTDSLFGGGGVDVLYGFADNDTLNGGIGGEVDALYGGAGADNFQVGGFGYGTDYVYDFQGGVGISDRILVATGIVITSQSAAGGNFYINFSSGSQVVVVGVSSVLAEDIVSGGF